MESNKPNNKHGITMRGDSLYCPLPLSLEPYWWCEPDCYHCYFRNMNRVWGFDLRPINLDALERKLTSGLKNKNPKSKLAHCLANKKTIRIGNKTDPFQPIEIEHKLSTGALRIFRKLKWSFVIQTRFTQNLLELADSTLFKAHKLGLATVLPIISPGMEKDWDLFERQRTTPIQTRFDNIQYWIQNGIPLGVNGEPFIPGHHTVDDFEQTIKRLKSVGCNRYNTYNFHFTPFVAKRLVELPGVDIEKIWYENQDKQWKKTLSQLVSIAKKHDMILGCPDFVNTGPNHIEVANTCCGIDVPNPVTFNTHYFKKLAQEGFDAKSIEEKCWDGSGDLEQGRKIINGQTGDFYTLKDAGLV